MDIRNININIESIAEIESNLKDKTLKKYLLNYTEAIAHILGNISLPFAFMGIGMQKAVSNRFTIEDIWTVVRLTNNPKKDPKEMANALVEQFEVLLKKNRDGIKKQIEKEIDQLLDNFPETKVYHGNLGLNALMNGWTLFEAFSRDIWIYCLNQFPKNFIFNILNSKNLTEQQVEGLTSKTISIGLLAKYDFNISTNLGDLLASKFDFTSVKGIKKAYQDLLPVKEAELSYFDDPNLSQLEIIRHILIHNAGRIDPDYLKRSNRKSEVLNERIELTAEEFNEYINCGIEALKNIFVFMDGKINNS